jgi:dTDP-4-dehydrorhamnose 3,5-epimerase
MIEGVKTTRLKIVSDNRGSVMHMLRNDSKIFEKFGEIYFSLTYPDNIKAWRMHKEMTVNYACIQGIIKLVLYDDRKFSVSKGKFQELILSTDDYFLVTVPPLIWTGFKNISSEKSILANCSTIPHRDDEILRRPHNHQEISYKW